MRNTANSPPKTSSVEIIIQYKYNTQPIKIVGQFQLQPSVYFRNFFLYRMVLNNFSEGCWGGGGCSGGICNPLFIIKNSSYIIVQ